MEENNNEIEERLQELIRQKMEENSALHKLLGRLSESIKPDLSPDKRKNNPGIK